MIDTGEFDIYMRCGRTCDQICDDNTRMPECYTCSRSGIKYDDEIDFAHLASAHPMGTEEVLDTPVHGNTPQPPQKLSEPSFASENFITHDAVRSVSDTNEHFLSRRLKSRLSFQKARHSQRPDRSDHTPLGTSTGYSQTSKLGDELSQTRHRKPPFPHIHSPLSYLRRQENTTDHKFRSGFNLDGLQLIFPKGPYEESASMISSGAAEHSGVAS